MPSSHLILCRPLLLLLSIFPSIRVFSNELALRIRWPKYWGFGFSISLSNEYSGLISFRMDGVDLLAVQETLKSLLQHRSSKASVLSLLYGPALTSVPDYGKPAVLTRWGVSTLCRPGCERALLQCCCAPAPSCGLLPPHRIPRMWGRDLAISPRLAESGLPRVSRGPGAPPTLPTADSTDRSPCLCL